MLGSQLPNINNQSTLHLIVKIAQEKLFYSYENAHELYKVPTNKINRETSVNIIILMKSQIVKNMLNDMPEDIKLFSRVYADLVLRIGQALNEQNLTKSDLAQKLDKRPSEISKWLNGDHNFTLKSLCKLQVELGVTLINIPSVLSVKKQAEDSEDHEGQSTISITSH
ncbi:helix-turn-helix domain-containing protein [Sphingobacterium faecium]|uniref:helix-turn-helix domain-containing protein n=1 Tax=Sphingobacterium faecium TaxID=34087 RepID=UPI002469A38B|nr:helix-turn-helix transcriptional regulator [Sphingobacterium faecium]MDH5825820.1 helix-turn-helix transcriptional regulator [Sphingobacterium faecium]